MIKTDKYELYKGDCLEKLKLIEDKSINLVLIDPPYNIGKADWDKWKTVEDYVEFMGKVFLEIQRVLKDNGSFYFFHNDFLQVVELQNWINKNTSFVFKQFLVWNKRFDEARNKGFLDGFCEVENLRNYQQMSEYCLFYTFQDETGLKKIKTDLSNFKSLREYSKNLQNYIGMNLGLINKALGHRKSEHFFYHSSTQWDLCTIEVYQELINIFKIDRWIGFRKYDDLKKEYENLRKEYENLRYTFNNLKKHHSIMNYEIPKKQGHITPKNTDMLEYIIKTSSNEDDIVLDCFMGGGSTGVACLNTNRKFIGIELEDKYFDIAKDRIENTYRELNKEAC
ncbi:site-specific DNA-methyltransferase [Clostridium perfringens]|uniref:DNA-methyltransferase n=1 Tax=Clostridium perfringens TaxID=1502 RepID=UPI001ABA95D9|nr:site-specific DNA-methyltransferase [Clostridium perfringens]MBO3398539.1 site-specific DNA-methyltransferase [Clostridium perfringens]